MFMDFEQIPELFFCLFNKKVEAFLKEISTQTIGQIIIRDQLIITGEIFVNTDWCLVLLGVALCKDRQTGYNLISGENNWLHLWEKNNSH